ncbi:hypothetical protein TELCIR_06060 [Teladorsagia circumcincta]|uniref:Uncharacterized protein n=1 Tax=Teladorsagia circumcincta TaxID=45464 RepID=A0A2G9UP60_TELCI|nr:hypothetical protein TELCIR_06060 [Teladorsagia circumcincta]
MESTQRKVTITEEQKVRSSINASGSKQISPDSGTQKDLTKATQETRSEIGKESSTKSSDRTGKGECSSP